MDYFIEGDNYEKYKEDYCVGAGKFERYEVPQEMEIPASAIEGISLAESELSGFWGQHGGGTKGTFQGEITAHIPEVKRELAEGRSLDEIGRDPKLGKCVQVYFKDKPRVIAHNGYYEFDANGRHRILAARDMGFDIPVSVIGEYK